jgi:GNAT superfamily N-acetyltransferase
MDLTIRSAHPADLDVLVALLTALFSIEADFRPDPERQRRGLALMLEEPARRAVLVAESAGAVVGMVTAQLVVSTAEGGLSALVEDMVVEAAQRGRGIGRHLLAAIEAWARERGAMRLQLLADRENAPALAFYERMGWRPTQLVCWRRGLPPSPGCPPDSTPSTLPACD